MSEIDVEALFRKVMALPPADRLRMAAGLIEAQRPDLLGIAVDVAIAEDVPYPGCGARLCIGGAK